jgi:hypothetical protein
MGNHLQTVNDIYRLEKPKSSQKIWYLIALLKHLSFTFHAFKAVNLDLPYSHRGRIDRYTVLMYYKIAALHEMYPFDTRNLFYLTCFGH